MCKYKEIVRDTVCNQYSDYILEKLLKGLETQKIVRIDKRKKENEELIDLTIFKNEKEKMRNLFESMNNIVKKCEEFEYIKPYRYIYLLKYTELEKLNIQKLIDEGIINEYTETDENDDEMKRSISSPTVKVTEEEVYLKFNLGLRSKLDLREEMKYPILVIIHKKGGIVEICQDVVPLRYNSIENFYNVNAQKVIVWLKQYLEIKIEKLDLQSIVRHMKSEKADEVKITALKLKREGMVAELDAANNSELMLPILDELKEKLKTEPIFEIDENTKGIRTLLEDFIKEIEDTSDLPAVKIYWENKKYKVFAYNGEMQSDIPYLRWNGELKEREGIDYVTKYISDCERKLEEKFGVE